MVGKIDLASTSSTLEALDASVQLTAIVRDQNGNVIQGQVVTWTSSPDGTASVSSDGRVTALANGTATITASAAGASGSATIMVQQAVASLDMASDTSMLASLEETVQLTASPRDANGHPVAGTAVAWTSSDETIATVGDDGLVTARGNGAASIMAAMDGLEGMATVLVEQIVASMSIEPGSIAFAAVGDTVRLKPIPEEANGLAGVVKHGPSVPLATGCQRVGRRGGRCNRTSDDHALHARP